MKKLIFNSSMPRSGSELLQVILHQNPLIYGSPTSPLLEYMYGARSNYELPEVTSQEPTLMKDAFIKMCSSMAEGYYSSITDRPIVIDKNRGWSHYHEWVSQWNPNPKMICMVRDLRNIISSMERIYRKNRHRPIGPDNPANIQNMTVEQRANYWLNTQPIGLALQRTLDLFQRSISDKILFIKYETLTSQPEDTMKVIYEYLDLPYYAHDFKHIKKEVQEDSTVFGPYGDHNVKPVLKGNKPFDWNDTIGKKVADNIVTAVPWYFNVFKY